MVLCYDFLESIEKFPVLVDYRALIQITKTNNDAIPCPDKMFDRLSQAQLSLKIDLKSEYSQI